MSTTAMYSEQTAFITIQDPDVHALANSPIEWLHSFSEPTHLIISGRDRSRCRALVTLIHGNEPSGFYAVYRLLHEGIQPATDLHILLPSVAAAKTHPVLTHRMLPGRRDLNRCFAEPYIDDDEGRLAQNLIGLLDSLQPEAVIDLHNTSGSGPSFGVTTFWNSQHEALLRYFTHRLIITDLRLAALMELSTPRLPILTVECGGSHDHESHTLAFHGLEKFALADNVFQSERDRAIEIFQHPIRVELSGDASLAYDDEPVADTDITLVSHIEDFNFGIVDENTLLGYCAEHNLAKLCTRAATGSEPIEKILRVVDGKLYPKIPLKLFMVTTNVTIARSDCLFYFVTMD